MAGLSGLVPRVFVREGVAQLAEEQARQAVAQAEAQAIRIAPTNHINQQAK
jgi:hypothetical protein